MEQLGLFDGGLTSTKKSNSTTKKKKMTIILPKNVEKTEMINKESIPSNAKDIIYGIPSSKDKDLIYRVNLTIGHCTCLGFKFSKSCSHLQTASDKYLKGVLPTPEEVSKLPISELTNSKAPQPSSSKGYSRPEITLTCDELDQILLTRLSKNFILRDFWYTSRETITGMPNLPRDWDRVIKAGKAMCEMVCEPILAKYGRFAITFGYQAHDLLQDRKPEADPVKSNPHEWDRMTRPKELYARIDIMPFCVVDGTVTKEEFGSWVMHNLDIDLLMQWQKSNVYCITISERQRRVWLEWGTKGSYGNPRSNCNYLMGEDYWNYTFKNLPADRRPKFYPSTTNGRMW